VEDAALTSLKKTEGLMNDMIGKTRDGKEIHERQDYSMPGHCAECGHHVDPYDPSLWDNLEEAGTDRHFDGQKDGHSRRDDEHSAVKAETDSMGSETLDDFPGGRFPRTRGDLKARLRWDGSCFYCGAPADRVGQVLEDTRH
jgi:hypothetical protein